MASVVKVSDLANEKLKYLNKKIIMFNITFFLANYTCL